MVVVHCRGGYSRIGLASLAWYMRASRCSEAEADVWLTERWPSYRTWNRDFINFLRGKWLESRWGMG